MQLKDDVRVQGLRPEMILAVMVAQEVWREQGLMLTLTSVIDSRHSHVSAHYRGEAVDLRIWDLDAPKATKALQDRLTKDYFVLLEKDHIHLEYRPRQIT